VQKLDSFAESGEIAKMEALFLLQRLFNALSIHPACLAKIRAEHDAVFGTSDPREIFIAELDKTIQALAYISACIKEALQLWHPAGSARMFHNGLKLRTAEGDDICVDKCIMYLIPHVIQRDPKMYGPTADEFVSERRIGDADTSTAHDDDDDVASTGLGKFTNGAWRPFERGPKNCIGQKLANLEARVVLACVVRRYDFVKVGVGEVELNEKGQPLVDDKGRCKTKSEVVSVSTNKCCDVWRIMPTHHSDMPSLRSQSTK
jgi:cytochrome P450